LATPPLRALSVIRECFVSICQQQRSQLLKFDVGR
jgi:hypothetical protein